MQPRNAISHNYRYRRVYGIFFALLCVGVVIASITIGRYRDATKSISSLWQPASVSTRELMLAMLDQENGQRGFVITGNESFLQPYRDGRDASVLLMDELTQLLASNDLATLSLIKVDMAMRQWQDLAAEPRIEQARISLDFAQSEVAKGDGQRLFDQFREAHATLALVVDDELDRLEEQKIQAFSVVLWALIASALTMVGVMVWILDRSRSWVRHREKLLTIENELRLEKAAIADRLRHIVGRLQSSLLPTDLPDIEGVELAVRYLAANTEMDVGGDFYDVSKSFTKTVSFSIGDVCGHDVDAAVLTGLVRHTLSVVSQHVSDPVEVLSWANQAVADNATSDRFVTAAHAQIEPGPGRRFLRLALAGHHQPILLRANNETSSLPLVQEIGIEGPLLGINRAARTNADLIEIDDGDQIIFFTDGLLENPSPRRNVEEIIKVLHSYSGVDAETTATAILDDYNSCTLRKNLDDVAVMVVKVR